MLSVASLRALHAGVELKSAIRAGDTVRAIVEFTKEGGFDLVVLGRSRRSEAWVLLLGTTRERVIKRMPCSVLVAE